MKKILLTIVLSLFLLSYSNELNANDILHDINQASAVGIEEGGEYEEDITLLLVEAEKAYLNGVEVEVGFVINQIGNHVLELYNGVTLVETINFTITPRFDENIDNELFFNKVILNLENSGKLIVNNREKENNVSFTKVGYYNVTVEGVNGYTKDYSFTLEDYKLHTVNGTDYKYDVLVNVDSYYAVYIDNVKQTEDIAFTKYGTFEVKVLGVNGFYEIYKFNIVPNFRNIEDGGTYIRSIRVDQGEAEELYIDGIKVSNIRHISKIGNHEIKYIGQNGYEKIYNITVKEDDLGINGNVYEELTVGLRGVTATLNGLPYSSRQLITQIGYHTLTVYGVNGYTNEYNFFVWQETPMPEEGSRIIDAFNLYTNYKRMYVNGAPVRNGYRFTETGEYEVLLWGEGDYTETYTFTYENEHVYMAKDMYYALAGFGGLTVLLYGALMWRRFKK